VEEDTIELIDYLRIVWKRKGLIIIGTLLCMVVAGVVSVMQPKTYRAEAIIKVGKVLKTPFPRPSFPRSSFPPVESSEDMVQSIASRYGIEDKETPNYPMSAQVVKGTSLIKIVQEGPDRKMVSERLKGVVDKIVSSHHKKIEAFFEPYREVIGTLEGDIKMMEAEIVSTQEKISSFNQKIDTPNLVIMYKDYQFNIQKEMRSVRQDLAFYQSFIKNVEEYTTNVIGDIRAENAPVKPKVKLNILLAGMAGLMFFLFLAFVMEYLERAK
jgi:hypothetical protein